MKAKRILLKKCLMQKKKIRTIGILGVHRGAGVTQTALMLAVFFAEYNNFRTAFVELNNHNDMNIMEAIYDWEEKENNKLRFKNIDSYKYNINYSVSNIICDNYDKIIMDFGCNLVDNLDEFIRCDIKIVLCSQIDWKRIFLIDFVEKNKSIIANEEWIYLIPYSNNKIIKELKSVSKRNIMSIPFERNVTNLSKETISFFNKLFIE